MIAGSIKGNDLIGNQVGAASGLLEIMTTEQIQGLFNIVLPKDFVQTQSQENIQAVWQFVNLKTTDIKIVVDMKPVIDRLSGQDGGQILIDFVNGQPECTEEQFQKLMDYVDSKISAENVVFCRPPKDKMEKGMDRIAYAISGMIQLLPSQLVLMQNNSRVADFVSSPQYQMYRVVRLMMDYILWGTVGLVLLILLLTLTSGRTLFACLGIPALVSGIIGCVFSAASILGGNYYLNSLKLTESSFDPYIFKIVGELFHGFSEYGLILCGVTFALGLIFLLISKLFKK